MLTRMKTGKLKFTPIKFEIAINDMFSHCQTNEEVNWLEKQLKKSIGVIVYNYKEDLKNA